MRFIFVDELIKFAKKNKEVHLVTSDLGYRAFEKFEQARDCQRLSIRSVAQTIATQSLQFSIF